MNAVVVANKKPATRSSGAEVGHIIVGAFLNYLAAAGASLVSYIELNGILLQAIHPVSSLHRSNRNFVDLVYSFPHATSSSPFLPVQRRHDIRGRNPNPCSHTE